MRVGQSRLIAVWSSLTRHRPHQRIDLLLGACFLVAATAWVGSVSPLFAAVLVVAVVGGYLMTLRWQKQARNQLAHPRRPIDVHGRDALDALDTALRTAPRIPLTGWVRVNPSDIGPLVNEARAAATASPASDQADKLAELVLGDRPVLFTDQVRVDRRRALKALAKLRFSHGWASDRR